jgi:hypothetical protein
MATKSLGRPAIGTNPFVLCTWNNAGCRDVLRLCDAATCLAAGVFQPFASLDPF